MKKISKIIFFAAVTAVFTACTSTKSTLKNVDENAPVPTLSKNNIFVLTEYSKDSKYGYDPDYPINVFYKNTKDENLNAQRFLNALAGPKGETITYTKLESCCPFPSKHTEMGAGFLDVYELKWEGQTKPVKLYMNIYAKGYLQVPVGLSAKK
ncbi:MAG: 2-dehydro-3-deoxyphosphooctonate aldolase [Flavobacterium sp.]